MAIVKTIDVAISATTAAFEAGMKRSVISFDALAIATKAFDMVMSGVRATIDGVTNSMENIDTASKAAASIGIATDELMRLRFAIGEITGIDPTQTDALLTRMIRTIAEGGKPASEALANIGLSIQQLRSATPEQAFMLITNAISQMEGQGAKAAAAVALFGKQGASLLPIFSGGAAALEESTAYATRFGLAVSSIDAIQIETANDSIARMSAMLEGVYNQIAVALAPQITALAQAFIGVVDTSGGLGNIAVAFEGVGTAVAYVMDIFNELRMLGDDLANLFNWLAGGFMKSAKDSGIIASEAATTFQDANSFSARYAENLKRIKAERDAFMERGSQIGGAGGGAMEAQQKAMEARQRGMAKAQAAIAKQRQTAMLAEQAAAKKAADDRQKQIEAAIRERQEQIEKLQSRGRDITEGVQTPIEEFAARVAELQRLQRGGFITQETFGRAFMEARTQFTDALAADVKPIFETMKGPAAITGGPLSGEAFSAFQEAKRGVDLQKEQTEYQKRMAANTDIMVRRGIVLAAAQLGGAKEA